MNEKFKKIAEVVTDHTVTEIPSRAFRLRRPDGFYWYSLIWSPGTITIMGDCGELQFTHYNATSTLYSAMCWANSSPDYLLGKSTAKKSYSFEQTSETLRRWADDQASSDIQCYEEELREYEEDLKQWAEEGEQGDRPTPPVLNTDDWTIWNYVAAGQLEDIEPSVEWRDRVWKGFADENLGNEHDAISTIQDIGLDDYYGCHDWSNGDLLLAACLIYGSEKILEIMAWEHFRSNPYVWETSNDWQGKVPLRSIFVEWMGREIKKCHRYPLSVSIEIADLLLKTTGNAGEHYGSSLKSTVWNKKHAAHLVSKNYFAIVDIYKSFAKVKAKGEW